MTKENPHFSKRWIGCDTEYEYLGEDRKFSKQERKRASKGDRSKYKKTDQDKIQRAPKKARKEENLLRGRVISISPQGIRVDYDHKTVNCFLKGLLKKEKGLLKNLVAVGDYVLFELSGHDGVIVEIEPRKSILSRADNLSQKKEQLIATNIDQVIITVSVVFPVLKPSIVDRYIIAALRGNMTPVVVVNKIDLLEDDAGEQTELLREFLEAHRATGITVIPISVETGEGIDLLKAAMKDKTSVFSGQSGVGKTTLINKIANLSLPIGDVVEKTKKGSHTTTKTLLLELPFGGWCVDTPGIKSFGIWDLKENEIKAYFKEIDEVGVNCRFQDCSHLNEQGCAVITSVENGKISSMRYQSYCQLLESVRQDHLRR